MYVARINVPIRSLKIISGESRKGQKFSCMLGALSFHLKRYLRLKMQQICFRPAPPRSSPHSTHAESRSLAHCASTFGRPIGNIDDGSTQLAAVTRCFVLVVQMTLCCRYTTVWRPGRRSLPLSGAATLHDPPSTTAATTPTALCRRRPRHTTPCRHMTTGMTQCWLHCTVVSMWDCEATYSWRIASSSTVGVNR